MKVKPTKGRKIKVLNSDDIYKVIQQILLRENKISRNKEHFWVVCLSELNSIMLIELLRFGAKSARPVDPADVFSFALQKQAKKLILVHYHPRKDKPLPSKADIDLANRMYHVGKFFNLPVLDQLIINEEKYFSFAETGVLEKLGRDKKYALRPESGLKAGRKKGEAGAKKRKA